MTSKATACCPLPRDDELFREYHDKEWAVPQKSDQVFFEKLCLEGFQSGLSWSIILHRRAAFRKAFAQFNIASVARFSDHDVTRLMSNRRLIRNRRKIVSAINNARCALKLQQACGSLAGYFWQFEPEIDKRPCSVTLRWLKDNPSSAESVRLANSLKRRGFSFVGPVNMYALMQALGLVNDHIDNCHRRAQIEKMRERFVRPTMQTPVD